MSIRRSTCSTTTAGRASPSWWPASWWACIFTTSTRIFRIKSRMLLFQQIGVVVGLAFLMQSLMYYLRLKDWILPNWLMIVGASLTIIFLPIWRIFYSVVVLRAAGSERVLLLGASPLVQEIGQHFGEHPEAGFTVLGYVENLETGARLPGGAVLGPVLRAAADRERAEAGAYCSRHVGTPGPSSGESTSRNAFIGNPDRGRPVDLRSHLRANLHSGAACVAVGGSRRNWGQTRRASCCSPSIRWRLRLLGR